MNIQSAKYANQEQTILAVSSDGTLLSVPWPCQTWHNQAVQEWLDAGNIIQPYAKYDTLEAAKVGCIAEINHECTRRILTKWPLEKQQACSLGVYPTATAEQCADDIAAMILASNTASDAVGAATTISEAEAVSPNWPVI